VPLSLARARAAVISDIQYDVNFTILRGQDIHGKVTISFDLENVAGGLAIDFAGREVGGVHSSGEPVDFDFEDEHIIIDERHLQAGHNAFVIDFIPDEGPLHREERYCYTLFVPDRARFAMPCFDQPDLKGRFRLTLNVPEEWAAVSNTGGDGVILEGGKRYIFNETKPLSTYLFSFAAGEFLVESGTAGGRLVNAYHMEPDSSKVERNMAEILKWHDTALEFLEEYTGIDYPFGKLDIVLIPAFTYRGMEHPGAILYRSERLFLDESATKMDHVRRASLICHETAHMWFGDLVTMKWFDDVWLKEAFAQFMADKCLHSFEIDHRLLFFTAHYAPLYEVERTSGTHPIRQELENLDQAGTLYGNIIYHKPPVMLAQLEGLVGEEELRSGLRRYLDLFSYGNATWEDLVACLDYRTDLDLVEWSRVWVMEAGRPVISIDFDRGGRGKGGRVVFHQEDPAGKGRVWPQYFKGLLAGGDKHSSNAMFTMRMHEADADYELPYTTSYKWILPDVYGEGFGYFKIDERSRESFLEKEGLRWLTSPIYRAVYFLYLREGVLEGDFGDIDRYFERLLSALELEDSDLNVKALLDYIVEAYWNFIPDDKRHGLAPKMENLLRAKMETAKTVSIISDCFKSYRRVATTPEAVQYLERIWAGIDSVAGLSLSERDRGAVAFELGVREVTGWRDILERQQERISNGAERARFIFIAPAVSADREERDRFFESLADVENRRKEPWVLDALYYLHHPVRRCESVAYIPKSLELLEEIRRTGDIFFPRSWLVATLRYHTSDEAATIVNDYLDAHPDCPQKMKQIILQAADPVFRANSILE
jgi:aminopeptidase N